ncbi:MAG: type II 3-dehydroquinate dehydratase [Halothermotrichaceae bacterium]
MIKLAVIHGPNMNFLGVREPDVYGFKSFKEINNSIIKKAGKLNIDVDIFQSNHEGEIIDYIQEKYREIDGIVINPAAFTHYSIALRDALSSVKLPVVEVHISNIYQRDEFRHKSVIAPIAVGQISGLGPEGYLYAVDAVVNIIKKGSF